MTTTTTTTTVNNNTVNNKIQDFGQKIGGARKDWFANMKEAAKKFAEVRAVDLIAAPLAKVVALPNLEKMTEAGVLSTESARAVLTLWRKIGTRPAGSAYLLKRWAEEIAPRLARIGAILNGEQITEEERAAVDYQILTAANWPADSFSFGRVKTAIYNGILYASAGRYYIAKSTNAADLVAAIRKQTEKDAHRRAEGVRLAICYNRAGEYFVTPENKNEIVLFKGSRDECYDQRDNHADELRARYAEIKSVPELRRDWNRPRVGEDWRKGQDITPETFGALLPFRGVEFGNWVTQAERASLLNSAFDGFQDLAQMLGIRVERVTLGGSLAFAFASRGISKAMAHYEPGRKVINLTKKNGAGCMAHEWFHACDNYAANLGGLHSSFMATENAADTEAGRCAMAISKAIRNTEFFHRSRNMARICGSYWVEPCELAARAFEGVCAYLLKCSGVCSDFLVNCLNMDEFTAADTLHRSDIFPYPSEAEAAALVPLYVAFFRALFGEGAELTAEQWADINAQQEKAIQERATAIAKREEAARKLQEEADARAKAEAEKRDQKRTEALSKHREELPALIAKAEADGVQNVATLATCSGAMVAGVLGGYIVLYWTRYNSTEERAALAYKRNGRLRKGAKVCGLCVESTQKTAAEYLQSISKCDEMAGHYVGAYGLNAFSVCSGQDAATFAAILSKAQEAQKRAQERASVAEPANTNAEAGKAEDCRENNQKGNRPEVDTTAAPADGLQLVEIAGGVAVVGDSRTTYRNRKEIKAHGATWNKTAQRWECTEPEAVAALRAWFGASDDEQTTNTGETSEGKQEPENVTRSQLMQVVAVARWFGSVEWSTTGILRDCDTIETNGNDPEAVTLWHRFGRPLNRRACVEMFGEDVTAEGEILHTMADHSAHYTEDGNTFSEWWQAVAEISNQERAPRTEIGELSEVAKSEAVASGAPHYSVCEKSPILQNLETPDPSDYSPLAGEAVRNEAAPLPDDYGVYADRYPVGSVWQYTQHTGAGDFLHEIRKRSDRFDFVVNIYNREGDGQMFPDKFPTYAEAYEALIRFRPGSRLCSRPYLSSEAS